METVGYALARISAHRRERGAAHGAGDRERALQLRRAGRYDPTASPLLNDFGGAADVRGDHRQLTSHRFNQCEAKSFSNRWLYIYMALSKQRGRLTLKSKKSDLAIETRVARELLELTALAPVADDPHLKCDTLSQQTRRSEDQGRRILDRFKAADEPYPQHSVGWPFGASRRFLHRVVYPHDFFRRRFAAVDEPLSN
jgi:hypothetical protein